MAKLIPQTHRARCAARYLLPLQVGAEQEVAKLFALQVLQGGVELGVNWSSGRVVRGELDLQQHGMDFGLGEVTSLVSAKVDFDTVDLEFRPPKFARFKLLCELVAPWPYGFHPLDDPEHHTMAKFDTKAVVEHVREKASHRAALQGLCAAS